MIKPKNIVLDIGNVLGHFRWESVFTDLMGLNDKEFDELAACTVRGNMWAELDRGEMSDEEVIEACIALNPAMEDKIREFFSYLGDLVEDYDYSYDWIREMKQAGYKVYILSNYGDTSFNNCRRNGYLGFMDAADGAVISYEVKRVKPHKEIYEALLEKYNLKAEECLFFDDLKANVDGAIACGMQAVQFTDITEAKKLIASFN